MFSIRVAKATDGSKGPCGMAHKCPNCKKGLQDPISYTPTFNAEGFQMKPVRPDCHPNQELGGYVRTGVKLYEIIAVC